MDAKSFLQSVGTEVASDFVRNRTILSFDEYLALFFQNPRQQARSSAQYLKDAIDSFGSEMVSHPSGKLRRFSIFDRTDGPWDTRVAGQEEVFNAIYRLLGNFVRAGRVNKLILLHGPNGSAKSSIIDSLKRGLEHYSRSSEGALYRMSWVFPSEKLIKGAIGFGEKLESPDELTSYAHLPMENIDLRLTCEMKDHPLFVIPRAERRKLLDDALKKLEGVQDNYVIPEYLLDGEFCHKCRSIYAALLNVSGGDYFKVIRHVQVERFYISRRYQTGTFAVEPQMSADASYHQVTADRSQLNMPPALQNVVMFQPQGPLVSANRGLIEYADLLKRPLETFKYLLGASETGEVPLEHFVLQLDEVLIASSNEKHLAAFKELPDFPSFKGRIELVRVPYLRRYRVEQAIYDADVTASKVGKHVAPHATELAALWAVLTRLKKPIPDRYGPELKELVDRLTPTEKLHLYEEGVAPDRLSLAQAKELKKRTQDIYDESNAYPNYEGRSGASAREIKTALFNAAQHPAFRCLHPLAVLQELEGICRDKTVYEFLQQESVDGYHEHEAFVRVVEGEYLNRVDEEVRDSMGLISEGQYKELFERYIQHVSHWTKNEKMRNRITGDLERADEGRMGEMEGIVMPKGEDAGDFRRGLIAQIGAHKLDHPDAEMDFPRIFPDLFRRLRDHFFEERRRVLRKNEENILKYLSDDRSGLSPKEQSQVESTLSTMRSRYGYCEACSKDSILFLMRRRYG